MGDSTSIEWTDATWNPVRGCSRGPGLAYEGLATERGWTRKVRLVPEHLDDPLRWQKPRKIFVNSMSDLFHEALPQHEIATIFAVGVAAHHLRGHTLQILTKRAGRMRELMNDQAFWDQVNAEAGEHVLEGTDPDDRRHDDARATLGEYGPDAPPPGVWLGVSVEDQQRANERIPQLLETPAAVRFLSCEPTLGPVDLSAFFGRAFDGARDLEYAYNAGLHWVIVGGESGQGARPFRVEWARTLVEQCRSAGVACFVKQLGADPRVNYYDDQAREWFDRVGFEWPDPIGWSEHDGQPQIDAVVSIRGPNWKKGGDIEQFPPELRVREFPKETP